MASLSSLSSLCYLSQNPSPLRFTSKASSPCLRFGSQIFLHPKTNEVRRVPVCRVSSKMVFPDLQADDFRHPLDLEHYSNTYKLMAETAEILNITTPLLYIRSNDSPVARAVALDTPYIVIHPSLIERLTPQELQVVFAHELAHLKCGHYALLKLMHIFVFMAEELPDCVGPPLKELFHWGQTMELSCDRASLLVAQDAKVVISAIMKLAGGIRSMVQERDVDAYLTSARAYVYIRSSSPTGVFGDACTRNPVPLLRAYEIDEWSRSKDYAMLLTSATTQGEAFIKKKITEKVSATTQGEALTKKKINEKVLEQFDMKKIIQNLLEQVYMAKNEKIIEKLLKQVDIGKIKK